MDDLRKQAAESYLRDGVISLGVAFNLSKCREWRFDQATQERAGTLIRELVELFHDSGLAVDPPQPRPTYSRAPRFDDPAFCSFLYELTQQAENGSFVGRRARGNGGKRRTA